MINIDQLKGYLEDSFPKIQSAQGKKMVLVIGKTGAGKSTTVNYLLQFPLKIGKGGKAYPINPSDKPPAKMGDSAEAITTIPEPYVGQNGVVYCDCPGFQDNRGPEMRVCVSLVTEAVVRRADSIDSIMAVIDWNSVEAGRAEGFKEIALTLGTLLKQNFDSSRSILFIFTKADLRYVNHEYICEKIDDVISVTSKKLDAEKAKLKPVNNIMSHTLQLGTHSHTDASVEIIENEVISLQRVLYVLKLMQANKRNLLLIDVFDKGESRQEIVKKLQEMRPVPKETFNFTEADSMRHMFQSAVTKEMVEGLQSIKQYFQLPQEIQKDQNHLNETFDSIKTYDAQLVDLESGRIFKGEQDPIVISSREKMEENRKSIASKQKELLEINTKEEAIQQDIWRLDTSDEIEFWNNSFKKGRSTMIGEEFSSFFEQEGTFIVAPVMVPVLSVMGLFERIEYTFEYHGAPFTRVKEDIRNGKTKSIEHKPDMGVYITKYQSDRGSSGDANVIIYGEKRNKPDNKTKIGQLRNDISQLKNNNQAIQREIKQLEETNQKLQRLIEEFLRGDKKNVKQKKHELESLKKSTQEHAAELAKLLQEKRAFSDTLQDKLQKKQSFFNIIEEIASFMKFDTKNYPQITSEFLSEYKILKNSLPKSTIISAKEEVQKKDLLGENPTIFFNQNSKNKESNKQHDTASHTLAKPAAAVTP